MTNPVQRLGAGWLPGFGILEHVGRKSGKRYRTPLNVFPTDDAVTVLLRRVNQSGGKNVVKS